MSRISDRRPLTSSGFTLAEVIVASSLSLIVLSGILAAYLFLGRNLTRLVNAEGQDEQSRIALRQFTNDAGAAIAFTTMTSSNLTLTVPTTLTNCSTMTGNATVTCAGTSELLVGSAISGPMLSLTNCSTTSGNATVTCASTSAMVTGGSIVGPALPLTTCSTTSGSKTVTCASTTAMQTGGAVSGAGIPSNAVVNSITNSTTFVMNVNATATATNATLYEALDIPSNAVVSSITNSTTFVMSANALATTAGIPLSEALSIPSNAVVNSITNSTTFGMSVNATATTTGATLYATPHTISYSYNTGPPATLTRTDTNKGVTTTLLTNIDTSASNGFVYYNASGATASSSSDVTEIGFSFATKVGTLAIGTEARYSTVSPRVVVRNKAIMQ